MQEISLEDAEQVVGGNALALAGLLVAVISTADKLSEFAEGVIEGYMQTQKQ